LGLFKSHFQINEVFFIKRPNLISIAEVPHHVNTFLYNVFGCVVAFLE
jgi:hypothetical protein